MSDQPGRSKWTTTTAYAAMVAGLGFLGLVLAGVVALTAMNLLEMWSWPVMIQGVLGALAALLAVLWLVVLYGLVKLVEANEGAVSRSAGRLDRIETLIQNQVESTQELIRLTSLSDPIKSVVYRERELEAMRDAFHDVLVRQEYEAAAALIQSVEAQAGYAREAEQMRKELAESRKATVQEKIEAAISRVNGIIKQNDWSRALRATQRLLQMFPDNPKVSALPERIQAARTKQKRRILQAYGEAVRKNDVDLSVALLQELDQYLAPQEAAALQESARGVLRARLHNLGVQFALSVTDERWTEAVTVGEEIIREYPNSRMAHEVGEKMDRLRALAEGLAVQQG